MRCVFSFAVDAACCIGDLQRREYMDARSAWTTSYFTVIMLLLGVPERVVRGTVRDTPSKPRENPVEVPFERWGVD